MQTFSMSTPPTSHEKRYMLPGFGLGQKADFTLTEFADPDGKAAYFRLRDFSGAVDDELFTDNPK